MRTVWTLKPLSRNIWVFLSSMRHSLNLIREESGSCQTVFAHCGWFEETRKSRCSFLKIPLFLKNTCKHKLKSEESVSRLLMREHTLSSPNIFRLKQMPMQLFTVSLTRKWFIPRKCSEKCFQSMSHSETELLRVF